MPAEPTEQDIVEGAVAWARQVIPEIAGSYDYATGGKSEALPDVWGEVETVRGGVREDERFPVIARFRDVAKAQRRTSNYAEIGEGMGDPEQNLRSVRAVREQVQRMKRGDEPVAAALLADGTVIASATGWPFMRGLTP